MGDDTSPVQAVAGWYPDPTLRFDSRYHNGSVWTADVSNDGERFVDPLGTRPSTGPPTMAPTPGVKNPAATAAMVFGIIAIGTGWMPFVVALAVVAGILAVVLGLVGRRRATVSGVGGAFATTGLITGAIGLLVCVVGVVFSVALVRAIDRFENPVDHEASITSCTRDGRDIVAVGQVTNLDTAAASFSIRLHFVRPGTDNPRRQALVTVDDLGPDETGKFDVTRSIPTSELDEVDCVIRAVRGELPFGVDPGT